MAENVSPQLIWEITRNNSSNLVKRRGYGGVSFSRDPLNLTNKYSRKHESLVNNKAIGLQPTGDGGIEFSTKNTNKSNKPASSVRTTTFASGTPNRKIYRGIVNSTAKKNYRPDLRADAVARASALKHSQRPVKENKPTKLRGAKARKAAMK